MFFFFFHYRSILNQKYRTIDDVKPGALVEVGITIEDIRLEVGIPIHDIKL